MEHFTPLSASIGGSLVGLSAAILWVFNRRIAGISGIVGGLFDPKSPDLPWRVAFLAALLAAPLGYEFVQGTPAVAATSNQGTLMLAGVLVGFGTRLGGGCTSGHGVCGNARLSRRSIVATVLFMIAAATTVFLSRHVFGG